MCTVPRTGERMRMNNNCAERDEILNASAVADQLERLPEDEARERFRQLTPALAAAVIDELETADAANFLKELPDEGITACLQLVPRTSAADLLGYIPEERRANILAGLTPDKKAAISNLLRYAPESAGGIMDNRFVAVQADHTVDQGLARLRGSATLASDNVLYVYVTDAEQRLVGVVGLRDLLFSPSERKVQEIMNPDVRFLRVADDQEEIARLIRHADFVGFPVVDEQPPAHRYPATVLFLLSRCDGSPMSMCHNIFPHIPFPILQMHFAGFFL